MAESGQEGMPEKDPPLQELSRVLGNRMDYFPALLGVRAWESDMKIGVCPALVSASPRKGEAAGDLFCYGKAHLIPAASPLQEPSRAISLSSRVRAPSEGHTGWNQSEENSMDDPELSRDVTSALVRQRNTNDVLLEVCQRTGWRWKDGEEYVRSRSWTT
jgi:hypothetical protein